MTRAPRGERHTVTRVLASGHRTVRDVCTRRPVQPRCAASAQAPPMVAKSLLPSDHRVAGRTPERLANRTGGVTARPRTGDRANSGAADGPSIGQRPMDAATLGGPGTWMPWTGSVPQRRAVEPRARGASSATAARAPVSRSRSPLVRGEDDCGNSQVSEQLQVFGTDRGADGHPGGLRGAISSYPRKEAYGCCDLSS
jgi:hypothetical protein